MPIKVNSRSFRARIKRDLGLPLDMNVDLAPYEHMPMVHVERDINNPKNWTKSDSLFIHLNSRVDE